MASRGSFRTSSFASCSIWQRIAGWVEQLAMLIGYSVCNFGNLSYASEDAIEQADAEAEKL